MNATVLQAKENSISDDDSDEMLSTFPGELYVKEAYKSFGVTKALNGASFSARFGEIHAIIGGNGCGKSTMAKVLSGVLPIDSGKVSVLGHHPTSPTEAREIGISMVFQEVMVADEASVTDNLFTGADGFLSKSLSNQEKTKKARDIMTELTGEYVDPEALVTNLPLGIKAWITIARALLTKPKLLILDESSAALDLDSVERLFDKMRQIRDEGAAVLIVTHRIAELIRISDRCTVMRDGKDVGVLEKGEITEENLLSMMTGKSKAEVSIKHEAHKTSSKVVVYKTENMRVWPDSEPMNFGLKKGEILGVTGLDGHGQDDFVRILAGLQPAYEGFPMVKEKSSGEYKKIRDLNTAKHYKISFVSGDRKKEGVLPNLSIYENLLIALYPSNKKVDWLGLIDWAGLASVFEWEVERLNIKIGPRNNLITSLSGGNQQKVMIGRSFAQHPNILLLLDPARGIDVGAKNELYRHLREFASEGNSVVFMSSELEEFVGLCSRVAVFRNGSIFDTFFGDDVEPVGILEGMFGQTRGGVEKTKQTVRTKSVAKDQAENQTTDSRKSEVQKNLEKTNTDGSHIKIIDFEKDDTNEEIRQGREKIKISYFN